MIEVITGIIGFSAGVLVTIWILKRKTKKHWGKGYVMMGKDKPIQKYYGSQTDSSTQSENKDPSLPNWF